MGGKMESGFNRSVLDSDIGLFSTRNATTPSSKLAANHGADVHDMVKSFLPKIMDPPEWEEFIGRMIEGFLNGDYKNLEPGTLKKNFLLRANEIIIPEVMNDKDLTVIQRFKFKWLIKIINILLADEPFELTDLKKTLHVDGSNIIDLYMFKVLEHAEGELSTPEFRAFLKNEFRLQFLESIAPQGIKQMLAKRIVGSLFST
jgi:hypothetical protein